MPSLYRYLHVVSFCTCSGASWWNRPAGGVHTLLPLYCHHHVVTFGLLLHLQWGELVELFRQELYRLNTLPPTSLLSIHLQASLPAWLLHLTWPACARVSMRRRVCCRQPLVRSAAGSQSKELRLEHSPLQPLPHRRACLPSRRR